MQSKIVLYLLILPLSIWAISSLNIEHLFKKNHINQIKLFYVFLSLIMGYLVTNFIWDFIQITK